MTESDWQLFPTLVRFDPVYATHFRCTRRRLREYSNLWGYARDLWRWPKVSGTIDLTAILQGYYRNDGEHNPYGIVAEAPAADWSAGHDRARLGPARVWFEETGPATAHGSVADLAVLISIVSAVSLACLSLWAAAGRIIGALFRESAARRWVDWVSGTSLIGLAGLTLAQGLAA